MESGATLRILAERKLRFDGPKHLSTDRHSIVLPAFQAFNSEGKEVKKVKKGDVVKLVSLTAFTTFDRVVHLRPANEFYSAGQLHGPLLFVPKSENRPMLTFYAEESLDLSKVEKLGDLFVSSKGV